MEPRQVILIEKEPSPPPPPPLSSEGLHPDISGEGLPPPPDIGFIQPHNGSIATPTSPNQNHLPNSNTDYPVQIGFEGIAPVPESQTLYPSVDSTAGPTPVETPGYSPPPDYPTTVVSGSNIYPTVQDEKIPVEGGVELNTVVNGDTEPSSTKKADLQELRETVFFRDGKRRIDYILAYTDIKDQKKIDARNLFEENLGDEGLELEYEDKNSSADHKTYFVKVHIPWDTACRMAELMAIKMPIEQNDMADTEADTCCAKCPNPFDISEDIIKPEADYFTADFRRDMIDSFVLDTDNKENFFTNAQRSLMVYEILLRTRYEADKHKFGIDRLLSNDTYSAAFPLHEGPFKSEHSLLTHGAENDRHLLHEAWARPGMWYHHQPLDLIRKYFGEKIGIYFSWLGFYTFMLIPASVVGTIVFLYGVGTLFRNPPSEEICSNTAGNLTMCPLCDKRCTYWKLERSCHYSRLTYLFDNPATVFFACFMAIWATMFLEFWKRKQAEIEYDWDVADFELEEHMRPDFEAHCNKTRENPVTKMAEPYLPLYSRIPRKCVSCIVVLFMICCVMGAVLGVIIYRIIIVAVFYASSYYPLRENAKIATTCTAALLNLVIIMLLNKVYTFIAKFLVDLERNKTDSEYEDSFTFKMFLFQCINYYSSIIYIAFFKGRFSGKPGSEEYYLPIDSKFYKTEECDPAGCLIELCIQLAIVMVGKQAFNNFKEVMLPKIMIWCRQRKSLKNETEENLYTRWEQDNDLQGMPPMGLFEEYLEMVIQYGFVTIFVAAFPLAPLFALINNIIEIRLDAYKFIVQWRRSPALKAQDIGIWFGILQGVTFAAVLFNAFIIGWTSDFIPKMVYQYRFSPDGTLSGFINFSLSHFDVNDFQNSSVPDDKNVAEFGNVRYCRYRDFRQPPWESDRYEYKREFWLIFTARLAFIILFEHIVFFLTWLVTYLIPDMPVEVKKQMLRERYLAKEARYSAAKKTHVNQGGSIHLRTNADTAAMNAD